MPQIPGVLKRCEFGQEISITLARQHYIIGLSLDKAIAEIEFFRGLKLRKSHADAMLNRMAREWLPEFETLYDLLAVSAVYQGFSNSQKFWAHLIRKAIRLTLFDRQGEGTACKSIRAVVAPNHVWTSDLHLDSSSRNSPVVQQSSALRR